jgi:phage protein D
VKVLRDYGAEPGDIADFVIALAGSDRDWAVTTPSALAKHFGERIALMAQVSNGRKKHDHAAQLMREAISE